MREDKSVGRPQIDREIAREQRKDGSHVAHTRGPHLKVFGGHETDRFPKIKKVRKACLKKDRKLV
jgi:hypothetical protein